MLVDEVCIQMETKTLLTRVTVMPCHDMPGSSQNALRYEYEQNLAHTYIHTYIMRNRSHVH